MSRPAKTARPPKPFWRDKTLAQMSEAEWESLCDGCGRCCLVKLEDEDTGQIHFTDVACRLFDAETCRCSDYANRSRRVHDCVKLDASNVGTLNWLPGTCAYRLVANGRDLPWWHPLKTGRQSSVAEAGISVKGRTIPEGSIHPDAWEQRLWRLPRARKPR